jgi:DNA-binding NarL/FixJ family response regulator
MIPVATVDEHPVVLRGYATIFDGQPDVRIAAAVGDPADLPDLPAGVVVIYDWQPFGERARPEVVRDLSTRGRVLVVSQSHEPDDIAAAIRAGACGYLTKDSHEQEYVAAVRAVWAGTGYVVSRRSGAARPTPTVRPVLSGREQEALAYIGRGFTHQQTARRMGVSKATVDTYVGRIRTKLHVGNKAELALAALRYVERDTGSPDPARQRGAAA